MLVVRMMAHDLESVHQGAFTFSLVLRGDLVLPVEDCADVSGENQGCIYIFNTPSA